jgi:hypothetical protein
VVLLRTCKDKHTRSEAKERDKVRGRDLALLPKAEKDYSQERD